MFEFYRIADVSTLDARKAACRRHDQILRPSDYR